MIPNESLTKSSDNVRVVMGANRASRTSSVKQISNSWMNPDKKGRSTSSNPDIFSMASRTRRTVPLSSTPAFFLDSFTGKERQALEPIENWRLEQRTRTVAIGTILALNLRVAPPGSAPSPRAREEAWILPTDKKGFQNGIESISQSLKSNYLSQCPKTSRNSKSFLFKQCLDPPIDKVKAMILQLRSFAKDRRILIHYNGHGVPKPSANGEIWVFNRELTQYIPLSLYDLQSWCGGSSMYIFDCHRGGLLLKWLQKFVEQRNDEYQRTLLASKDAPPLPPFSDYYAIAPCEANQMIPSNPDLPADLLTSCLTTPIQMSLRWASKKTMLQYRFNRIEIDYESLIINIPGSLDDRQTPLGELNWIFTAITEAIAWELIPSTLFQKLFREDPVVASLFRNFLLADRILRDSQCTPVTYPRLPKTHQHPMWKTWDNILDIFLEQLPRIVKNPKHYVSSSFFQEHLTAFELWLSYSEKNRDRHPRELPIVLQAILSPVHRLRALDVFKEFLDLGVWAVNLALGVGIFHYVLRLLQRATGKAASILIFIWSKIIAADHSLQKDLIKADAHLFFIKVLKDSEFDEDDRIRSAFILSVIMDEFEEGQTACLKSNIIPICSSLLNHSNEKLRRWVIICIGKICEDNYSIKQTLIRTCKIQDIFLSRIHDQIPENRASVIYAIGKFIACGTPIDDCELDLALSLKEIGSDITPSVRREFVVTLSHLICVYEEKFKEVALASAQQEVYDLDEEKRAELREIVSSDFGRIWRVFYSLQYDPMPSISSASNQLVIRIHSLAASELLKDSTLGESNPKVEAMHNFLLNVSNISKSRKPGLELKTSGSSISIRKQLGLLRPGSIKQTSVPVSPKSSRRTGDASAITNYDVRSFRRSQVTSFSQSDQLRSADHRASVNRRGYQPASSKLYQKACEGFNIPCLHKEDNISPIKTWKSMKQEKMIETMDDLKNAVSSHKLETQVAALVNEPYHMSHLLVHPFYPVIVSTSTDDIIRVWDWKEKVLLNRFSNTNPPGTFVSSISFVNELEDSDMLMTGSSDGVMRIWRTYYQNNATSLVTAWRAHKQPDNSSSLCHIWNQRKGILITAGEYPVMSMWDVNHGIAVQDIPTGTQSCITTMSQESPTGPIVVTGDTGGQVRIFDCRVSSRSSLVKTFSESSRPIINVQMMYQSMKIVAGSIGGDVRFFDLRSSESTFMIQAHSRTEMASLAAHTVAPIIATGTQNQTIKITNHSGVRLNDIKYYSKYLGQRIGAVSCLKFHPVEPLLVAGNTDGVVAVYQSSVL